MFLKKVILKLCWYYDYFLSKSEWLIFYLKVNAKQVCFLSSTIDGRKRRYKKVGKFLHEISSKNDGHFYILYSNSKNYNFWNKILYLLNISCANWKTKLIRCTLQLFWKRPWSSRAKIWKIKKLYIASNSFLSFNCRSR